MNTSDLVITIQAYPGAEGVLCGAEVVPCDEPGRWLFNDSSETVDVAIICCDTCITALVKHAIDAERPKD